MTASDWPRLLLLQFPYRCHSCNQRFYRTARVLVAALLVLGGLIAYPISYQLGSRFEQHPTVKTFYQPLHWVEQQLMSATGTGSGESI
jgi:hypothetical protein